MTLADHHRQMLTEGSGIAPDIIAERGYRTSTGHSELKSLGIWAPRTLAAHGLLLPLWGVDGRPAMHVNRQDQSVVPLTIYRPDTPLVAANGRIRKYLNPAGMQMRLDSPVRCHDALKDPHIRLYVTEGQKKVDALVTHGACAIGLLGVDCWRGTLATGGKTALPDWEDVALNREVCIVYDSDVMTQPHVGKALQGLTRYLTSKGAAVLHAFLPSPTGAKVGIDDFLLTHPLQALDALLQAPQGAPSTAKPRPGWQTQLLTTQGGQPLETFGNLYRCIANSSSASALWYDLVQDRPMVGDTALDERAVAQAALAIEEHVGLPIRHLKLVREALVAQCRTQARDPIREWLEGLAPWDQQPRLLTWLSTYAGAPATTYVKETGRLWLVSMVARAMVPGCQCRSVIVLMGAENIGKSELVKLLASEPWYRDVSGSLEGKEGHILMKGVWLVELGELATMGKTEENRLKSFITIANDGYVPKYANDPIKQARRTILVGTLNPEGDRTFLRGQTGNTRYYPVAVTTINLEQIEAQRAQLFAEALAYYRDHLDDWWRLSPKAEQEAREVRDDHRVRSIYEEPLGVWLDGRTVTCWQEICEHFLLLEAKERWKDTKLQKDIASAMAACGWHQQKPRRLAAYGLVRPWVPTEAQ
jgi:putative DNA primase/helicase